MKHYLRIVLLIPLLWSLTVSAKLSQEEKIKRNKQRNEICFKCHNQKWYYYHNPETEMDVKKKMFSELIVDSVSFYNSNHRNFKCVSCHSDEYEEFPHAGELRMEEMYACNDCHGGDEDWAHLKFDEIEEEYAVSAHSNNLNESFSCWMCHDPHNYKTTNREEMDFSAFIKYDNGMCLKCHDNADNYQRLSDDTNPDIAETHDWLPNQSLHFKSIRCIECHTEISEETMVSHNVTTKDKAVKDCIECHSSNSRLVSSLYKHMAKESRSSNGFINGVMLDQSFVIGANRNSLLSKISGYLFLLTLGGVTIHGLLRLIIKKK